MAGSQMRDLGELSIPELIELIKQILDEIMLRLMQMAK